MTEKTLTTENIKPALDALRGELAPWPVVAKKQDRLNTAQLNAANSGITSSLVAQIIANTAAIRALESAITGTGLRALVVASLPAVGTTGILYIVPITTYDPDTDADVVNYSNEYIWIPVEDGTASEGHYEQVGQTGIVINNGQLTITVNGTSVGTFTANQSGDTTAAITVPTNADYVDRTTDQTVAGVKTFSSTINGTASKAIADEDGTSIKTGYVNVAGNQTVTGDKSFTGSNTFNNILPNATNSYSLGSSSYQWAKVYSEQYYYNGTAWGLDKNNQWSKAQFYSQNSIHVRNVEPGVTPSSDVSAGIRFENANASYVFADIVGKVFTGGTTFINLVASNKFTNGALDPNGTTISKNFQMGLRADGSGFIYTDCGWRNNLIPYSADTGLNLGTSTNQWNKTYSKEYYYNGTAWGLDKENVWRGSNKFTDLTVSGVNTIDITQSTLSSATISANLPFKDNNNRYWGAIRTQVQTDRGNILKFTVSNWKTNGTQGTSDLCFYYDANLDKKSFYPTGSNVDFGTSTNKWKTLNGVNPGALSLPDFASETGVSLSAGANIYTPVLSGWLSISTTGDISIVCGNFCHKATDMISVPVIAGKTYTVTMPSAATGYFYSCLGNV